MQFLTDYDHILAQIEHIDPVRYSRTRNFTDGAVSHLSPYISRGVISVNQVRKSVLARGLEPYQTERLMQELAWREYWQRVWQDVGDGIFTDLKQVQPDVQHHAMPEAILSATTGIHTIDEHIQLLYESGYLHNHVRMYVASICCNIAKSHWLVPSRWLYFHLLDGDLASNSLSWQWVAEAFSSKKYYCNQENINHYTHSVQANTFLDKSYEDVRTMEIPDVLRATAIPALTSQLPATAKPIIDAAKTTLIYNSYNLDPLWRREEDVNRVLLLEPSHFQKFPVGNRVLDFILALSGNISNIQIYTAEFEDLAANCGEICFKEHPAFRHYRGTEDSRDWIAPGVTGYFNSFFSFWKKVTKSFA